jgi:hypothetical protein
MGEFTIKNGQHLLTFHNFDDIPLQFDHLISFKPDIPGAPHTPEEHEEIHVHPTLHQLHLVPEPLR